MTSVFTSCSRETRGAIALGNMILSTTSELKRATVVTSKSVMFIGQHYAETRRTNLDDHMSTSKEAGVVPHASISRMKRTLIDSTNSVNVGSKAIFSFTICWLGS